MTPKDDRPRQLEQERPPQRGARPLGDDDFDARLLDLEPEEESPFLRGQKRVPVRRGPLPRKTADRLLRGLKFVAAVVVIGVALVGLYRYATTSWRFRIDSSDHIEVAGSRNVSQAQLMEVMGGDIGRNIFYVPLGERKRQIEEIPWVESATIMRLLPNRLRVQIRERTPLAFVQLGSRVALMDGTGVIMEVPPGAAKEYSFPVIVGMQDTDVLSTRAARMRIFARLLRELDADGANYSRQLSEVELSDPENVKVTVADPAGAVLLHLGSTNFQERFRTYIAHVQQWRQQFQKVESVDLRYERQVIVNPDSRGRSRP